MMREYLIFLELLISFKFWRSIFFLRQFVEFFFQTFDILFKILTTLAIWSCISITVDFLAYPFHLWSSSKTFYEQHLDVNKWHQIQVMVLRERGLPSFWRVKLWEGCKKLSINCMTSFIDDPFLLILFFVKMFTNTNCEYRKAIDYTFKPTSCW